MGEGTSGGGDLSHVTSHDALGECLDLLMLASMTKFQDECPNGSISEVYSPPRVVLEAARYGLRPGNSFNLQMMRGNPGISVFLRRD